MAYQVMTNLSSVYVFLLTVVHI